MEVPQGRIIYLSFSWQIFCYCQTVRDSWLISTQNILKWMVWTNYFLIMALRNERIAAFAIKILIRGIEVLQDTHTYILFLFLTKWTDISILPSYWLLNLGEVIFFFFFFIFPGTQGSYSPLDQVWYISNSLVNCTALPHLSMKIPVKSQIFCNFFFVELRFLLPLCCESSTRLYIIISA